MSIPVIYSDSDKSKYYSYDDYTPLSDYHHSFYTAQQTSQLRMVIAPGTVKYFNKQFTPQKMSDIKSPVYANENKLAPIVSKKIDDGCDYMSYPKK